MAAVEIARGDVSTNINFLKPLGPDDDPYYIYIRCALNQAFVRLPLNLDLITIDTVSGSLSST